LLLADAPLKVVGKIDLRDESEPKISIEKLELWKNSDAEVKHAEPAAKKSNGILYVLVFNNVEKDMVADVLAMHPGNTPCQAQVKQNGVSKLMEFSQRVEICPDLLSRLEDVLGVNRVKYVERKIINNY